MSNRLKTATKRILDKDKATEVFDHLYENVDWQEGVRSKKGFTRKACPLDINDPVLDIVRRKILKGIKDMKPSWVDNYIIMSIYLNLYEDGEMWTPNHNHPGQHQFVISLGQKRPLVIAKKEYVLKSGEAVMFGSSIHGVPKGDYPNPRISIAVFLLPIN